MGGHADSQRRGEDPVFLSLSVGEGQITGRDGDAGDADCISYKLSAVETPKTLALVKALSIQWLSCTKLWKMVEKRIGLGNILCTWGTRNGESKILL